ncbi:uncharacterized protein LOC135713171 [Ochlerotatus camptorhynchus]|uniref:uncharacterized protein LOC135713171 n=1 Tax=Ochlerotatus camptorhynchus TaxID=644619 RepID=UPI0031D467A5
MVFCLSIYGFYDWYCDGPITDKYLKQWVSILIVWILNLLVTAVIYGRQFVCEERINKLNSIFVKLAEQHRYGTAIKRRQFWLQVLLLTYLSVSIAGMWFNMNPTYWLYSMRDWSLSVVLMAPIIVCSLTASRYCMNFLAVSSILDEINRDLSQRVHHFHRMQPGANISVYKLTNIELELSDHLDRLIIRYDKLYDVVLAIIEIYSPSILFLLVLDFGQVTFQLYMFFCDLSRSSMNDLHLLAISFVSAFFSFSEIYFVVDGTSKLTERVMEAIQKLQQIGIVFLDHRLVKSITVLVMVLQRTQEETIMFYNFALDKSFLTTIIAASCSYLILLIQTV